MCVRIFMHTHIYRHTYIQGGQELMDGIYVDADVHIHIHTYTYIHTGRQELMDGIYVDADVHIHIHTYTYIHTGRSRADGWHLRRCGCAHTYTYIYIHIHTYTYIYIHTYREVKSSWMASTSVRMCVRHSNLLP